MRARITRWLAETTRPSARDVFLWDTDLPGFGLKITPAGNRIFVLQYRIDGRLRRYTIGNSGSPWSVLSARHEATRLLRQIAERHDPAEEKAAAKRDLSIADLCDLYLSEGCRAKKSTTIATDLGRIERHIKPLLGRRRTRTVSRRDIERFMADVASGTTAADIKTGPHGRAIVTGGKGTAVRTVGLLGAIFSFAVKRGIRFDNPVHGINRNI
jgi:Arm DNA-binding domain